MRAAGGEATLVPMDLLDGTAIDRLGGALAERFGRLDVLVACAGDLGALSPVGHVDPNVVERVFALHARATFRLVRSLDPLLRASEAGRALFVTCAQAREARPFWSAYAASKAALEAIVLAYAAETARMELRVNLVDPGPMRTRLRARAYPGEDPATLPTPDEVTEAFVQLADAGCTRHGELIRARE